MEPTPNGVLSGFPVLRQSVPFPSCPCASPGLCRTSSKFDVKSVKYVKLTFLLWERGPGERFDGFDGFDGFVERE